MKRSINKIKKICSKGHTFYKSSDCPTCPICEKEKKPKDGFLATLSAPARRALLNKKIDTIKKLTLYSEKEISELHGVGPTAIYILRLALKEQKLSFKK